MNKETFVTNSYGIRIKKCCASCINKKFTGKRYGPVSRACVLNKDIWTGNHGLCRSWNMDSNLYNNIGKLLGDIKKAEYIAFVIGWRSAEIRYFDKRITSDIQITEDSYNESWKDRQTDSTHQTYIDGWRRAEARLKSINLSDVAANKVHIHEASVDFIRSEYQRTYGSVFLDLE